MISEISLQIFSQCLTMVKNLQPYSKRRLELNFKKVELQRCNKIYLSVYFAFFAL